MLAWQNKQVQNLSFDIFKNNMQLLLISYFLLLLLLFFTFFFSFLSQPLKLWKTHPPRAPRRGGWWCCNRNLLGNNLVVYFWLSTCVFNTKFPSIKLHALFLNFVLRKQWLKFIVLKDLYDLGAKILKW